LWRAHFHYGTAERESSWSSIPEEVRFGWHEEGWRGQGGTLTERKKGGPFANGGGRSPMKSQTRGEEGPPFMRKKMSLKGEEYEDWLPLWGRREVFSENLTERTSSRV